MQTDPAHRAGNDLPGGAAPALDDLPLPALWLDVDAQALRGNAAFAAFTGLAAGALTGTGWFAALAPDRRQALHLALARREDFTLELRLLRHDGVKAWVEMIARWQPEHTRFLCLMHDVTGLRQSLDDVQAEAQRLRTMANQLPVLMAYFESSGFTCVYANRLYAETFGLDERNVLGRSFAQIIGAAAAAEIQPRVELMLQERRTVNYVRQLDTNGGRPRWLDVSLVPHVGAAGGPARGAFVLISDITRHREAEIAVRESEERMAKFMAASVEGIAFHKEGILTDVNEPICRLVGLPRERIVGRHVFDFIAPPEQPRVRQVMEQGAELDYETELIDARGRHIPVEFIVRTLMRGAERQRMTVVRDLRDRRAEQERMHRLAHDDALTGLPNRASFMARLDAAVAASTAGAPGPALLLIDLDHFRRVNDALGHLVGDRLLHAAARRLARVLPAPAVLGRIGGDQFAVLLPAAADATTASHAGAARAAAQQLRAALRPPMDAGGQDVALSATIGLVAGGERVGADDLLRRADAAMSAGKAGGRDQIVEYEPELAPPADPGLRQEHQLAQALARREFELLLQPRLRADDGTLVAVQALLRWRHPQRGWLAPRDFVELAEHRHLLQPLADWALREALRLQRAWRDELGAELPVVLDLSALHPHGLALAHTVGHVLAEQRLAPGTLMLELDERIGADDLPRLQRILAQLDQLGVGVILDNLGSGGVALAQLRHWPLAGLKLAASLVGGLPDDAGSAAIVRALAVLARGLSLPLCAPGVASAAQQQWLQAEGCELLQGPWLAPPMAQAQCLAWLAARLGGATSSAP